MEKTKNPQITCFIYGQKIFDKGTRNTQGERCCRSGPKEEVDKENVFKQMNSRGLRTPTVKSPKPLPVHIFIYWINNELIFQLVKNRNQIQIIGFKICFGLQASSYKNICEPIKVIKLFKLFLFLNNMNKSFQDA